MPNTFIPPAQQGKQTKEGAFLLGDSWNMRHPLTGGGMTCAFNDVVILRDLLLDVKDLADWEQVSPVLNRWFWARKPLASTVNILSVALYDLFGADGTFALLLSLLTWPSSYYPSTRPSLQTRIWRFSEPAASNTSSSAARASASPSPSSPRTSFLPSSYVSFPF